MSKVTISMLILMVVVSSVFAVAEKHEHRQLGTHEYGVGQLNIALENEYESLYIELVSPAINIVGFEHAPNNAEQEKTVGLMRLCTNLWGS